MLDIERIRQHPDEVRQALVKRQEAPEIVDRVLELDRQRRDLLQEVESLKAERNRASKEMGALAGRVRKASGEEKAQLEAQFEQTRAQLGTTGERIGALDEEVRQVDAQREELLLQIPNVPHPSVPLGASDAFNVQHEAKGPAPRQFDFEPLPHWDLGPELGILDFERGVKLAGTRFYVLRGAGARLQRALITWFLDVHILEQGYTEVYLPFIVKEQCMWGAGQLPKLRDNIYHDVEDDVWLVGTAEIPITNLHRDEILNADELPLHYVAYTACFRRERVSAGRDVRGIKRGHQFDKVEMYKFTLPENSYTELEAMVRDAEVICERLEIPYRRVEICTGDLSFASARSYDLEMWAPGSGEWLEVSSLSNTEDFQARRANVRYRPAAGAKPQFVHTLNGSGLALPRVMIAVMENYQQADGSIAVPAVLRPYMGGIEVIR